MIQHHVDLCALCRRGGVGMWKWCGPGQYGNTWLLGLPCRACSPETSVLVCTVELCTAAVICSGCLIPRPVHIHKMEKINLDASFHFPHHTAMLSVQSDRRGEILKLHHNSSI